MAREVRISPDGESVAIRGNAEEEAWNAWAIMNATNGGGWVGPSEVEGWRVVPPESEETPEV